MSDRPIVPPSRASARNGRDETTGRDDGTKQQPVSDRPAVVLSPDDLRITELLRHIEAGRVVLIILENQERGPPAAKGTTETGSPGRRRVTLF